MKDKSKVLKTYGYMFYKKLQFVCLIAVYLTDIHTFSEPLIYLSCFIFCYKVIEYQSFQKVKHTTLMFHFLFQCFILKILREKNKNTEGATQKHCGNDNALPQCFEK